MRYIVSLAVLPVLAAGADLTQADWSKLETASDPGFIWEQKAPGDGGTSWYLRIHPSDSNCLVQSCDMSASYITHDGSRTYRSINNPDWRFPRLHYISGVDFCRKAPDIGYAGTESNGLFKTTDRGKSWQRLSTASIERIFDWKFARIPISTVTVDPSNPDCVWAGTGYLRRVENRGKRRLAQGLLHSSDGGRNWTLLPDALPRGEMALRILMFEQLPGVILVATDGGIYASRDAGKTFSAMMKGLPEGMTYSDIDGMIEKDSGRLILVAALESSYRKRDGKVVCDGGIWRCDGLDGTWREITGDLRLPGSLFDGLPDFKHGLGANPYWLISTKMIWHEFMEKPENRSLYENVVLNYHKDPAPFHRKWSQANKDYKRHKQYGELAKQTLGIILPDFHTVRIDPRNADTVYASIFHPWIPYGVWKTGNGGKHWSCITRGAQGWEGSQWKHYRPANEPALNIRQAWTTRHPMNYGTPRLTFGFWDVRKFDLSRSNPDILYFHSHRVTYRSENGGASWTDASNRIIDPATSQFAGAGNSNMCVFDLEFHPKKPERVLFWMADCGLKVSRDGGNTLYGLPNAMVGSNQWVLAAAVDPDDPERFYAFFNCRDWLVGGIRGQYFIESRDFGKTFRDITVGKDGSVKLPPKKALAGYVAKLLADPSSPREMRRFLALNYETERYCVATGHLLPGSEKGAGLLESVDGGVSWRKLGKGLEGASDIVDLVPAAGDFSTLYAAAAMRPGREPKGGLFISRDSGRNWEKINCPLDSVTQVVPFADGRLYIAGGIRETGKSPENRGGVYYSADHGKSWQCLLKAPLVSRLAVHPENSQLLYCTIEPDNAGKILSPGVWRSGDGGKNWIRVNNGLAGAYHFTCLKWHPVSPDQIWLGTYGSGYYYLKDPAGKTRK